MIDLGVIFDKYILSSFPKLAGAYHAGNTDSCCGTKSENENTQNNVIEVETRRDMNVLTYQQHQETFEAAANMLCQLKQRYDRLDIAIII